MDRIPCIYKVTQTNKQKKNCPSCSADCFATANVVHVNRHAHTFRIEIEKAYFCRLAFYTLMYISCKQNNSIGLNITLVK